MRVKGHMRKQPKLKVGSCIYKAHGSRGKSIKRTFKGEVVLRLWWPTSLFGNENDEQPVGFRGHQVILEHTHIIILKIDN